MLPCCLKWQDVLLPHGWMIFHPVCLSICLFVIYLYHIFFIQSSVDRYLRCFHMLAFVNNAVRKTLVKMTSYTMIYVLHVLWHLFFIIVFRYSYSCTKKSRLEFRSVRSPKDDRWWVGLGVKVREWKMMGNLLSQHTILPSVWLNTTYYLPKSMK